MERQRLTWTAAIQLANPRSWVAAIYPALLGELYGIIKGYPLTLVSGIALLVAVIAMQSAVNTLNDYYDFVNGTDSLLDHVEVRDAAMFYGNFPPRQALWLGLAFLVLAAVVAVPICLHAGAAPFIIGGIGSAVVWSYSGGILPISHLPLGEIISGVVMGGLIPLGVVAAVTGIYAWPVLVAALPLMLGIALIMMTNNTCDIEKDRLAGRRTLPTLLGRTWARRVYRLCCVVWLILMAPGCIAALGWYGILVPLYALAISWRHFAYLFTTALKPTERIHNMKHIVIANILGNGAYILIWFVGSYFL